MSGDTGRATPVEAWRLSACCFFIFAPIGIQLPFFPLWISHLSFSPMLVALLIGLTQIMRFCANLLVPSIADRSGDAATVLLGCAIVAALAQSLSGLPFGTVWIFVFSILAAAGQAPMMPIQDAIVLHEVRRRAADGEPPLHYGRVRSFGSASVLILMLASGALASVTPPGAIIWIIAGASVAAALAVAVLMPRDRFARKPGGVASTGGRAGPGRIGLIIAASSAIQASHAMIYAFGSIGWRQAGFGDLAIGFLWAAGVATEVAFFVFANRFARGRNLSFAFLISGGLVALVRWLVMAAQPGPALLLLAQFMHAGSFAATYLGTVMALSDRAGNTRRARDQGWLSGSTSLSLAAATFVCGPLWAAFGARAYLFVALLAGVGTACAIAAALLAASSERSSKKT